MAKQTLDALRARMESLRAEWRELPKRRDTALLKGDKDALLDTQIRERQIPYEYLQAIRQRTELFTEQVHAQLNDLAKRRAPCAGIRRRPAALANCRVPAHRAAHSLTRP
jgi:hypothetical protein